MENIIGRSNEIAELQHSYNSGKAEFVVLYGRRRVGKTYLINEVFKDKFAFKHTGLSPYDQQRKSILKDQLQNFHFSLVKYGFEGCKCPKSWLEAFFLLEQLLEKLDNGQRQLVFIDEMPWMDTMRSGFITALESFWNGWGCSKNNLMLIVCGSATAWIQDKLILNQGGLYNRLTNKIKVSPFTLKECEEFYQNSGIVMSRTDVVESYMVLGGIPYYMNYFRKGLSLPQNIDLLFFAKNAKLDNEFNLLFGSIFSNPEEYKKIVSLLATKHVGFTRDDICEKTEIPNGGGISLMLSALEESGFIMKYKPFTDSRKGWHYKLIDNFCLFWLKFKAGKTITDTAFWTRNHTLPAINIWRGITFEEVCFNHTSQIKRALGIADVLTEECSWSYKGDDTSEGTQIDMIIKRSDNVVDLCEMKFYKNEVVIDKQYHNKLESRIETLYKVIGKKSIAIQLVFITASGLCHNEYSGLVQRELTIDDLFN